MQVELSDKDRVAIASILRRRANEVALFHAEYTRDPKNFGSVELALSNEITRLRSLADKVDVQYDDEED